MSGFSSFICIRIMRRLNINGLVSAHNLIRYISSFPVAPASLNIVFVGRNVKTAVIPKAESRRR